MSSEGLGVSFSSTICPNMCPLPGVAVAEEEEEAAAERVAWVW